MTREELIRKVALKMDEISSSEDVTIKVTEGDNNPLYTQINALLNESVNDVLMKAPIFRLSNHVAKLPIANTTKEKILGNTRERVIISVPDDFLRLVSISDNLFQRPVVELAIEGDEVDKMQHNRHLVAKSAKPVAVIGNTDKGKRIYLYSYNASDMINTPTVLYIKRYANGMELSADANLDEYVESIVTWVCAGKVFSAQGDVNKGKICDENAMSLMA